MNGKIKLMILFDRSSLEVFVNDGEHVLTTYVYPDAEATSLAEFSHDGTARISNFKIWNLGKKAAAPR